MSLHRKIGTIADEIRSIASSLFAGSYDTHTAQSKLKSKADDLKRLAQEVQKLEDAGDAE